MLTRSTSKLLSFLFYLLFNLSHESHEMVLLLISILQMGKVIFKKEAKTWPRTGGYTYLLFYHGDREIGGFLQVQGPPS